MGTPAPCAGLALSSVTVTQKTKTEAGAGDARTTARRCRWCARPFDVVPGPGRPKEFCRRSCRQRDYEARRQSAALGLGDGQIVVARADLDARHDRLYALEAAIEDAERDLADTATPGAAEYAEALGWVLEAAKPVVSVRFGAGGG